MPLAVVDGCCTGSFEPRSKPRPQARDARWRDLLTGLAGEAVGAGHLRADLDIDQFVWELYGIYLGHHASARFLRDASANNRARSAFDALLARAGAEGTA